MEHEKEVRTSNPGEPAPAVQKHAYSRPELTVHGPVEKITHNINPGAGDGIYGPS